MADNIATRKQAAPTGDGADITVLARKDFETVTLQVPERGLATIYAWLQSAAAEVRNHFSHQLLCPLDSLQEDLEARAAMGAAKYGTRLRAHNGRDALIDLYQELLDALVYARQYLEEKKDQAVVSEYRDWWPLGTRINPQERGNRCLICQKNFEFAFGMLICQGCVTRYANAKEGDTIRVEASGDGVGFYVNNVLVFKVVDGVITQFHGENTTRE